MQVLGTLLPPLAAPTTAADGIPGTIAAAGHHPQRPAGDRDPRGHAQQAEVIKFAQMDGRRSRSLLLRSPDDFIDPITGQPLAAGPRRDHRRRSSRPSSTSTASSRRRSSRRSPPDQEVARSAARPSQTPGRRAHRTPVRRPSRFPIRSDPSQRTDHQGPTRARWPTRSVSSSSTTSRRPAIT